MKIAYAFMVVSHPIQPSAGQLSAFLIKVLPELATSDGDGKLGFLWVTHPINSVDITALAIDAFGNCIIDESKYIYRTLHLGIDGGEAKCLVVYTIEMEKVILSSVPITITEDRKLVMECPPFIGKMLFPSTKERIGRPTYWGSLILLLLVSPILLWYIYQLYNFGFESGFVMLKVLAGLLAFLVGIDLFWITLVIHVKRLHDLDLPGWMVFILFIPVINLGFLIYLATTAGTSGSNKYGNTESA